MHELLKKKCDDYNYKLICVEYVVAEDTTYFTCIANEKSGNVEAFNRELVDILKLDCAVVVKIKEMTNDSDKVAKSLHKILTNNVLTTVTTYDLNYISTSFSNDTCSVVLKCSNIVKETIEKKEKENIISSLKQEFLNDFVFDYIIENLSMQEVDLETRKLKLDYISHGFEQNDSYIVTDISPLFGDRIINTVRPISSINAQMKEVFIAGKINFFRKSTYKKTYNKDGKNIEVEKCRYNFELVDHSGKVNAVIFPTKAATPKCDLLDSGKQVVVLCDVEEYANKLNISIKEIAFCKIPEKVEITKNYKSEFKDYITVKPEQYVDYSQVDMFSVKKQIPNSLKDNSFVVFDLETTGITAGRDRIIEIGAVKVVNGAITETFETFVNPEMHIPEGASEVNNITDDMVADAPLIRDVIPDFYKFTRGCVLVAHNIEFDIKFIRIAGEDNAYLFDNDLQDTLYLARKYLKRLSNHKLHTVCEYLGISLVGAHRALNDTIATAQVFIQLSDYTS